MRYVFPGSFLNYINLSKAVVELLSYIHKLTTEERTDGRTDEHDVYRTITFNRSCNVLKVNPSGKTAYGAKRMPKQDISNSNSISILGIPSTDSRHNGKCNICAFHEEIMHLKTGFLSDYQLLFLPLNGPQIETSLQFDRLISID